MSIDWSNWSGNQIHRVESIAAPADANEVANIIKKAAAENKKVRTWGSAHSFNPFWTDDCLVSLDQMKGLVHIDAEKQQIAFKSGTKLFEVGEPAWDLGLSMKNMGDIDKQSIAGAISTGTHGTGETLQNLSSQVEKLTIVNGEGKIIKLDRNEDEETFKAVSVSMGAMGIITEVSLQLQPAYFLHERNWQASVAECEEMREDLIRDNRHFEFFWDPGKDVCLMKTLNMCAEHEHDKKQLPEGEEVGRSYQIIPSLREQKFNEMEFSVPRAAGWDCFLEVRSVMQKHFPDVRWPVEFRTLESDGAYISSASGRETVTLSVHEGHKRSYTKLFNSMEVIFRSCEGRPHWGKVHSHSADDFEKLYPDWGKFNKIRNEFDPQGLFLNPYLCEVLGTY